MAMQTMKQKKTHDIHPVRKKKKLHPEFRIHFVDEF